MKKLFKWIWGEDKICNICLWFGVSECERLRYNEILKRQKMANKIKKLLLISFLIVVLFLLVPSFKAEAAIAYSTSTSVVGGTGATYTVAYTVTGANSMLLVFPTSYDTAGWTVSGVTYNGVAMTEVGSKISGGSGYNSLYGFALPIASPDGSAHNIVVSQSGSTSYGFVAASYSGVVQALPEASSTAETTNSATWAGSVTTITNNAWVVAGYRSQGNVLPTVGANTIARVGLSGSDNNAILEYSSNPKTPAGSITLNISGNGVNAAWSNIGKFVSIAPYVAPPASARKIRGVGISR